MRESEPMTFAEVADRYAPKPEIVGPYSIWPRARRRGRVLRVASTLAAAGVCLHYAAPLLA